MQWEKLKYASHLYTIFFFKLNIGKKYREIVYAVSSDIKIPNKT